MTLAKDDREDMKRPIFRLAELTAENIYRGITSSPHMPVATLCLKLSRQDSGLMYERT